MMNKIRISIIVGIFFLIALFLATSVNAVCLVDTCLSLNELRERNIATEVSYGYGYIDGYNDQMRGKASNPSAIFAKFRRVSTEDPAYYEAEVAYRYSGAYRSGYSLGYTDAKNKRTHAVPPDFLKQYGVEQEATVQATSRTPVYNRWNIDTIDTSQNIENLAYGIGYSDAIYGNSKSALKIMYDLSKDETPKVLAVYEWIRDNRGTFTKKYKEGFDAGLAEKTTATTMTGTKTTQLQTTTRASQLSKEEQEKNAYAVGYKVGMMHAQYRDASNPQLVLNFKWILNARYTSDAEQNSENWYTLPKIGDYQITQLDVEQAMADETSYMKGYREGYNLGLRSSPTEEMSDDEIVYQIGCEVGTADAKAGVASNPYTYTWKTHRYKTKTEELEYSKMIRYNRADYITGYRECYADAKG